MGIRFYCPNGHKLNVKEFQAGRKAICPFCGARTQIPASSTRKSSKQEKADRRGSKPRGGAPSAPEWQRPDKAAADNAAAPGVALDRTEPFYRVAGENPAAPTDPAAPVGLEPSPGPPVAIPPQSAADNSFQPPMAPASAMPSATTPVATGDPLAEAGDVVWYVRPPSGGQFGPAGRDIMRTWLAEGRVSPDSLVWHEGWRDWQEAVAVFRQLAEAPPAPNLNTLMASEVPPIADTLRTLRAASREQSRRKRAALVIGLLVALIILVGIFLLVWLREPKVSAERATGRPTAVWPLASAHLPLPSAARPRSA